MFSNNTNNQTQNISEFLLFVYIINQILALNIKINPAR